MTGAEPPAPEAGADPSMEDILASIRRILNEDETPAEPIILHDPPPHSAAGMGAEDPEDDVLMLDEAMLIEPAAQLPSNPAPAVPPMPIEPTHAEPPAHPAEPASLLAPETAAAATGSVEALMRTLTAERTSQVYRGGPTLEDLVREEIRPLLKSWLDQHLPPMVERLVRQEIERVIGRAAP